MGKGSLGKSKAGVQWRLVGRQAKKKGFKGPKLAAVAAAAIPPLTQMFVVPILIPDRQPQHSN